MATYGKFPGVKITTQGGGISGVQVGEEEKLVLFAPGDGGTASVNTPTQINSLSEADRKFGSGSPLAEAMKLAIANGANRGYLYGVKVEQKWVTDEDITNGGSAGDHSSGSKLANGPLVEDADSITVTDVTAASDVDSVDFEFKTNTDNTTSDFTGMDTVADTFYINPLTREWVAGDGSSDYEVDYSWYDYEAAFHSADDVLEEGDTGIYAACTEAPNVHTALETKIAELRLNYQLAQGVAGARPNKTLSNGDPGYTADKYADTMDSDTLYLFAPSRQKGSKHTLIPAVGGMMAGHPITDPIYNDTLAGLSNLAQRLSAPEAKDLREADVIPVREAGSIRVKANRSTGYTSNADWERDFWRRRIVDRVILISHQVGDDTVGRINDDETREDAYITIYSELQSLVRDRLLKPNEDGEVRWMVEVTEDSSNSNQVNIDVGVTPQGVVKRIDQTITINT